MPGNFLAKYMPRRQQEAYIMNGGIHHAPGANMNSEYRASSGTVVTTLSMDEGDPNASGDPAQVKFLNKSDRPSHSRLFLKHWTTKEKFLLVLCAIFFIVCIVVIAVTRSGHNHHINESRQVCLTKECVNTAAQLMSGMDLTADPCKDFYQYACGTWNKQHLIPEDKPAYTTFEQHREELERVMKVLLETPKEPEDSDAILKTKMLFQSCMNESQPSGSEQLKKVMDDLGGWPILDDNWSPDSFNLEDALSRIRGHYDNDFIISCRVKADDKNSSVNIIHFDQTALGMPSREYYLLPEHKVHRDAYRRFLEDLVKLMGASGPGVTKQIDDILEFETKLTQATSPSEERSDTGALYMKMPIATFQAHIPFFDVLRYLRGFIPFPLTEDEPVVVFALQYILQADKLVRETEKRTVSNYLIWRLMLELAPQSTAPFKEAYSRLNQVMKGVTQQSIQWKECVKFVNDEMGMAVGAMFIKDHFKKSSLDNTMEMIDILREAFIELLDENDWMDDKTKQFAREKALAIEEHIGYPGFIADPKQLDKKYDVLRFLPDDYFHNILQLKKFDARNMMLKLREPIRKEVWEQQVVQVNAFYNPNTNTIIFPAGVLQPVFYSETFPKSLNFGGIGVVIGHEITHGFDDKGRQYDKYGNIKQWWDNNTIEAFKRRAQCMIDQYSSFKYEQIDEFVNGRITQGENIADNGGLKQSFRAYRKWVARNGEELPLPGIDLTHNQLFFLNYARIWCGKLRDEEALIKVRTSAHSPNPVRLLGAFSNSYDFAEAFNCPKGSRLNPVKKCSVW